MSNYFEVDALNHSLLKQFKYSGRHYLAAKEQKNTTKAMDFGTFVHGLLLEPENMTIIIDSPLNKNTKAYKEWRAEQGEGLIVSQADIDAANKMIDNLTKKNCWNDLLKEHHCKELELYYNKDGYACKAKLDIKSSTFLVDIKTTANLDEKSFFNSIIKYDYHTQAAWYQEAAILHTFKTQDTTRWDFDYYIVAMEKTAPYESIIYKIPRQLLAMGRRENKKRFAQFKYCMETNDWYGYEDKIHDLKIPDWFLQNNTILGDIL